MSPNVVQDVETNIFNNSKNDLNALPTDFDAAFKEKYYKGDGSKVLTKDAVFYFLGFALYPIALETITEATKFMKPVVEDGEAAMVLCDGVFAFSPPSSAIFSLKVLHGPDTCDSLSSESKVEVKDPSSVDEMSFEVRYIDSILVNFVVFDFSRMMLQLILGDLDSQSFFLGFPLHHSVLNSIYDANFNASTETSFLGFPLHESVLESIRNVHVIDAIPAFDENAIPFMFFSGATVSPLCSLSYEEWKSSQIENSGTRFTWDLGDESPVVTKYFDIAVQSDDETDIISSPEDVDFLASVVETIDDAVTSIFIFPTTFQLKRITLQLQETGFKAIDCGTKSTEQLDESGFENVIFLM